jgi:glycosyltransferase involved in cell wall biosynthesis
MSWGYDLIFDARRSPLWAWATRYTLQRSAIMIGDCDAIRRLATSYGMHPERIVTFPWGIDLQHFHPGGREQKDPGTFTLFSTRTWEPIYGVDVIAQAFVIAAQQRPELRLVMLGGGSQDGMLRRIFEQGGVPNASGKSRRFRRPKPDETWVERWRPYAVCGCAVGLVEEYSAQQNGCGPV